MAQYRYEYSIEEMARVLGVSKQGFYQLQKRGLSRRRIRWESLSLLIRVLFDASGRTAESGKFGKFCVADSTFRSATIKSGG